MLRREKRQLFNSEAFIVSRMYSYLRNPILATAHVASCAAGCTTIYRGALVKPAFRDQEANRTFLPGFA